MDSDDLKPIFYASIASGAVGIAVLAFVGDVWSDMTTDHARQHVIIALHYAFTHFMAQIMLLGMTAWFRSAHRVAWHLKVTTAASVIIFLTGLTMTARELVVALIPEGRADIAHYVNTSPFAWVNNFLLLWVLITLGLWAWKIWKRRGGAG